MSCHLWPENSALALSSALGLDLVRKDGKEMEGRRFDQMDAVDAVERE
jgi:hypothetical protein